MQNNHSSLSGLHILGELSGLSFENLNNLILLENLLLEAIPLGGATVCGHISKQFQPHGVTVLVLLSESHASIHTYPEAGCLFLDIFTCGDCRPQLILNKIIDTLMPGKLSISTVARHLHQRHS
ncbi:MAG: adenosylmethionine decarboxylase [Pseudomonas sp.]